MIIKSILFVIDELGDDGSGGANLWNICIGETHKPRAPLECEERRANEKGATTTRSREMLTFAQSRNKSVTKMKLLADLDSDVDYNLQMGHIFRNSHQPPLRKVKFIVYF
jgi:hypothetical protein